MSQIYIRGRSSEISIAKISPAQKSHTEERFLWVLIMRHIHCAHVLGNARESCVCIITAQFVAHYFPVCLIYRVSSAAVRYFMAEKLIALASTPRAGDKKFICFCYNPVCIYTHTHTRFIVINNEFYFIIINFVLVRAMLILTSI